MKRHPQTKRKLRWTSRVENLEQRLPFDGGLGTIANDGFAIIELSNVPPSTASVVGREFYMTADTANSLPLIFEPTALPAGPLYLNTFAFAPAANTIGSVLHTRDVFSDLNQATYGGDRFQYSTFEWKFTIEDSPRDYVHVLPQQGGAWFAANHFGMEYEVVAFANYDQSTQRDSIDSVARIPLENPVAIPLPEPSIDIVAVRAPGASTSPYIQEIESGFQDIESVGTVADSIEPSTEDVILVADSDRQGDSPGSPITNQDQQRLSKDAYFEKYATIDDPRTAVAWHTHGSASATRQHVLTNAASLIAVSKSQSFVESHEQTPMTQLALNHVPSEELSRRESLALRLIAPVADTVMAFGSAGMLPKAISSPFIQATLALPSTYSFSVGHDSQFTTDAGDSESTRLSWADYASLLVVGVLLPQFVVETRETQSGRLSFRQISR